MKKERRKLFASYKKSKEIKTVKDKEIETGKVGEKPSVVRIKMKSGRRLLVSFVISAALFAACLVLIKSMSAKEATVTVLVAKSYISSNQKITSTENIDFKEIPVSLVPDGVIKNISQIDEMFAATEIGKGQILTEYFFTDKQLAITAIEEPIEVSVGVSNLDQIVGGVIREGDTINISVVEEVSIAGERSFKATPVVSKAYVSRVFTSGGIQIASEDRVQSATTINILVEASEEKAILEKLNGGKLRISLVCE